jgi:excisionase family DNA binding protein
LAYQTDGLEKGEYEVKASRWVESPASHEPYVKALFAIEELRYPEHPHRQLLDLLHDATAGMTNRELGNHLLPQGGRDLSGVEIANKLYPKFRALGKCVLRELGASTPLKVEPPVPNNKEYAWAAFAWWDDSKALWGLLPEVARALELFKGVFNPIPVDVGSKQNASRGQLKGGSLGDSNGDDWLTVAQVAKELGISTRRVTALCKERRLGERFGGKVWRISNKQLDEFKIVPRRPGPPRGRSKKKDR